MPEWFRIAGQSGNQQNLQMMDDHESKKKIFSKIALMHLDALKRYALSLCKNHFDADDLVSETILKAFQNFERIKDQGKVKQWLFRILNNQFISNYRSKKYFIVIDRIESETINQDQESFSLFETIAKSDFVDERTPEKEFISKLTREDIEIAIDGLPVEFRQALILCDVDDFSYAEISAILNVPIGTVRSRISRARTILHKKLWQYAEELGIKKTKSTTAVKKDYVCTCGKEETENELQTLT